MSTSNTEKGLLEFILNLGHPKECSSTYSSAPCDCHMEAVEDLKTYMELPYGSVKEAEEIRNKWGL